LYQAAAQQTTTEFLSEEEGYRLQIPQGWVIQDENLMNSSSNPFFTTSFEPVASLCLENEALPVIGGEFECELADLTHAIAINKWSDLQSRPEFENQSSVIITTNDLLALWIQDLRNASVISEIKIQNNTDVDEFTKLVNMTFQYLDFGGTLLDFSDDQRIGAKSSVMFVLSQDRNTAYSIVNTEGNSNQTDEKHPPALQEVFDSFELVE
jgi:hypothetical protein